jgi:hypothetical protein
LLRSFLDDGAVEVRTPDGVRLQSAPLCLGYFDPASGRSVVLAVAEPVEAELLASNQVVYAGAFANPGASVLYTYDRGGFRQDILLHEAPPPPARFGLPESCRLEILTEFAADSPEPQKFRRVLGGEPDAARRRQMAEPDFVDEELRFGTEMLMAPGRAFASAAITVPADNDGDETPITAPVGKHFQRMDGRPMLVEAVDYQRLKPWLDQLPKATATAAEDRAMMPEGSRRALAGRQLPPRRSAQQVRVPVPNPGRGMARLALDRPSVVLDYEFELSGSKSNFTFTNGATVQVVGPTTFGGLLTIEGGAIIKFKKNVNASLTVNGGVACKTSQYLPAVFTADEDDSVGDWVYPSSPVVDPNGAYYASTALVVRTPDSTLQHLRIAHAQEAIRYEHNWQQNIYGETLRHVQIVHCQKAITALGEYYYGTAYWKQFTAGNVLLHNVDKAVTGKYYRGTAEHLTVNDCDYLAEGYGGVQYYSTLTFKNSILANVAGLYGPGGGMLDLGGGT